MRRTLFLFGPSDSEGQNAIARDASGDGVQVTASLAGNLPILDYVLAQPALRRNIELAMAGYDRIALPPGAAVNIFNLVGDADAAGNALHTVQQIANQVGPRRLFNPPSRVIGTARARLPTTLAGVPGCRVPRVVAAAPGDRAALREACRGFGCWPLILRARGFHGGDNMVKVENSDALEALPELPWLYGDIFLLEYVDCRGADGLYEKTRIAMVDGQPYPRHSIISGDWLTNTHSRQWMHDDEALRRREEQRLAWLVREGLAERKDLFREIHSRIGLDVYGIDLALRDDHIVVFEANACMSFVGEHLGGDRYGYLPQYIGAIRRALKKMLLRS